MDFSRNEEILQFLKNTYCKLLVVDLKNNTYSPEIIDDDEVNALGENLNGVFSDYTNWFCNSEFVHQDDKQSLYNFFQKAQAGKSITYRRLIKGEYHRVTMILKPTTLNKDKVLLYVADIEDIYNQEREKIMSVDEQTSLLNRHAFYRDCNANKNKNVGIIFADLNGLKYTNDNYGHAEGDKLILKLANLLKLNFQDCNCYHISGDEFIVAAFDVSLQKFLTKAMAFHKSMWSVLDMPIASIGYSIGEAGIDSVEETLKNAERSMYDDKLMFYQRFPKFKRK